MSQYFIDEIKSYGIQDDDSEKTMPVESTIEAIEDELDFRTNVIRFNANTESVEHKINK